MIEKTNLEDNMDIWQITTSWSWNGFLMNLGLKIKKHQDLQYNIKNYSIETHLNTINRMKSTGHNHNIIELVNTAKNNRVNTKKNKFET